MRSENTVAPNKEGEQRVQNIMSSLETKRVHFGLHKVSSNNNKSHLFRLESFHKKVAKIHRICVINSLNGLVVYAVVILCKKWTGPQEWSPTFAHSGQKSEMSDKLEISDLTEVFKSPFRKYCKNSKNSSSNNFLKPESQQLKTTD